MARETFIQEDDLGFGIVADTHLKTGENIQKLSVLKVLQKFSVSGVGMISGFGDLDVLLMNETPAVGAGDLGVLTDAAKKYPIFISGTDNAFTDDNGDEVIGKIAYAALITHTINATLSSTTITFSGTPDFLVDDWLLINGDLHQITSVGAGTAEISPIFNQSTGAYLSSRLARWRMEFYNSLTDTAFTLPTGMELEPFDTVLHKRVYLADVAEEFAIGVEPKELDPEIEGAVHTDLPADNNIEDGYWVYKDGAGGVLPHEIAGYPSDIIGVSRFAAGSGTSVTAITNGLALAQFETGLTLVEGDIVFASQSTLGAATNVPPSSPGDYIRKLGVVSDASMYVGSAEADSKAKVVINMEDTILL